MHDRLRKRCSGPLVGVTKQLPMPGSTSTGTELPDDHRSLESMRDRTIHGVRALHNDGVRDDATIVVEGGRIAAIELTCARRPGSIDGRGAFCLPGLVDSHTDGLEEEINPRPNVLLPQDPERSLVCASSGVATGAVPAIGAVR